MTPVRSLLVAAASIVALTLTGCATQEAGSAATFVDGRITETQLSTAVADVLEAKGQSTSTPDPSLVQQTLGRLITQRLINELAAREGVVISAGQLDEIRVNYEEQVGGSQQLLDVFLQENVAPSQLDAFLQLQLQAQELGYVFNPRGSAEEQGAAVFAETSAFSVEQETTVSPRYGTWDPAALALGPVPSDLAALPVAP